MIQSIDPQALETVLKQNRTGSPTVIALPPGYAGRYFAPPTLVAAERTLQHVDALDITGFERYLAKQVTEPTGLCIFVDVKTCKLLAVIDYAATHGKPGWNQHTVALALEFSTEFAPLFALLNTPLTQEEFLNYLDAWGSLFLEASVLQETIADFRSHNITKVTKVINQRNGTGKLIVTTDEVAGEEVNLPPPFITANVAIFPDQPRVEIQVLVRYRPNNGAVGFLLLIPGFEAMLLDEIRKLEVRLFAFLTDKDWHDKATVLRAKLPALTQPLAAIAADIKGLDLPHNLTLKQPESAA